MGAAEAEEGGQAAEVAGDLSARDGQAARALGRRGAGPGHAGGGAAPRRVPRRGAESGAAHRGWAATTGRRPGDRRVGQRVRERAATWGCPAPVTAAEVPSARSVESTACGGCAGTSRAARQSCSRARSAARGSGHDVVCTRGPGAQDGSRAAAPGPPSLRRADPAN